MSKLRGQLVTHVTNRPQQNVGDREEISFGHRTVAPQAPDGPGTFPNATNQNRFGQSTTSPACCAQGQRVARTHHATPAPSRSCQPAHCMTCSYPVAEWAPFGQHSSLGLAACQRRSTDVQWGNLQWFFEAPFGGNRERDRPGPLLHENDDAPCGEHTPGSHQIHFAD